MGFGKPQLNTERELDFHKRMNDNKSRRGTRLGAELSVKQLDHTISSGKVGVLHEGTAESKSGKEGSTFQGEERELAIELSSEVPPVKGTCEDSAHPPITLYTAF